MVTEMDECQVDLDGFRVGTGGDEQAGTGVAQIVNPEPLWEVGLLDCGVPDLAAEVAVAKWRTER
jgi:hypothetical protein